MSTHESSLHFHEGEQGRGQVPKSQKVSQGRITVEGEGLKDVTLNVKDGWVSLGRRTPAGPLPPGHLLSPDAASY